MKKWVLLILTSSSLFAQASEDSSRHVLTLESFLSLVLANHPLIKQAELQTGYADAELMVAKGAFDPSVSSSLDTKQFMQKEYYNLLNGTLKVPLWFPLDPKLSIDQNRGLYLDPHAVIPETNDFRQLNAGLSLPLGRGLLIDERRSAVMQAKTYREMAEAERIKLVNKTLLTAIKDYWEWYRAYQEYKLIEQSIQFANELFRRILIDYETGEASVIDTIQAKITLQTRMASFEKANYEFINSGLILSTHLWTSELAPLELSPQAIPDPEIALQPNTPYPLHDLLAFAEENHPEIQKLNGKKEQLAIERKWNLETLKPRLDLSYTLIDAPLNPSGDFVPITFTDNYKLGVDFYVPLFLRKERGKLEKTNLKLMETDYSLDQRKRELAATIQSRHAEIKMAETLTRQYKEMAENYHQLLQAEFLNVDLGESDLFKLTIQQDKYIEAQIKYIQNLVKFQKSKIEILHDTGYPLLALAPVTRP